MTFICLGCAEDKWFIPGSVTGLLRKVYPRMTITHASKCRRHCCKAEELENLVPILGLFFKVSLRDILEEIFHNVGNEVANFSQVNKGFEYVLLPISLSWNPGSRVLLEQGLFFTTVIEKFNLWFNPDLTDGSIFNLGHRQYGAKCSYPRTSFFLVGSSLPPRITMNTCFFMQKFAQNSSVQFSLFTR